MQLTSLKNQASYHCRQSHHLSTKSFIELLIFRAISIEFRGKLAGFKDRDFKVKLGSILENDIRNYYNVNRFSYIEEKLGLLLTKL